jgi:hypothetical protein
MWGTPDDIVERLRPFRAAGLEHVYLANVSALSPRRPSARCWRPPPSADPGSRRPRRGHHPMGALRGGRMEILWTIVIVVVVVAAIGIVAQRRRRAGGVVATRRRRRP